MKVIVFVTVVIFLVRTARSFNNFADTKCGIYKASNTREGKIVGGQNADKGEFPWIVSITRRGGHFCGGTVVNKKHILTAGHCLCTGIGNDIMKPSAIKITLSQHDLTHKNSDAFEMSIKSIMIHPEYSCNKVRNDIAILELEKDLDWSENVVPACLPVGEAHHGHSTFENILATVAGWGWTNEHSSKGGRAKTLQKARVNVIETERCREWYKSQGKKTKIQESQICAGHEQGGIDACWADSGGPLMVGSNQKEQMIVVGVVSTGIGCARPYLPGIYTRVSNYIPWIRQVLKQHQN